jgi:hypothetical protein
MIETRAVRETATNAVADPFSSLQNALKRRFMSGLLSVVS